MATGQQVVAGRAYVLIEAMDRSKAALKKIHLTMRTLRRHLPTLRTMSRLMSAITLKIRQMGDSLARMGRSMFGRGVVLGGIFTGFAYNIMAGVRAAKEFRNEMNALNAVLKVTGRTSRELETLIRRLGRTTSFTATQIAAAGQELARGGFSPKEITNSLEAVLALARAGKVDLTTASKSMVRSIRAFGMESEDAYKVADQLFQASREGTATVEELAMSLSFSAGTASNLGLSLGETLGILSKMANQMLHGTKGGTSLNQMLLRLATRSRKVAKALRVDVFTPKGDPRSIVSVLSDMEKAMARLSKRRQLTIMEELFNVRGARAAAATMRSFRGIVGAIHRIEKSAGEAKKAQEEMNKGIVGSVNKIMSALNELAISFGDIFVAPLKYAEENFIPILNWLSDWIQKNKEIGWQLLKVVGAIGAAGAGLAAIGVSLMAIGALIASIGQIMNVVVSVPFAALIASAVALRGYFKDTWEFFGDTGVDTVNRIVDLIKAGNLEDAFKISKEAIKKTWDVLILEMKLSWKEMIRDVTLGLMDLGHELRRIWQEEGHLGELLELDKKRRGASGEEESGPYGWFKKIFGGGVIEAEMRRGEAEWQELNAAVSGAIAGFLPKPKAGKSGSPIVRELRNFFLKEKRDRLGLAAEEYKRAADINKGMTDKRDEGDKKRDKLEEDLNQGIDALKNELNALKKKTAEEIDTMLGVAELKTFLPQALKKVFSPFKDAWRDVFKAFTTPSKSVKFWKGAGSILLGKSSLEMKALDWLHKKITGKTMLDRSKEIAKGDGSRPGLPSRMPIPGAFGVGAFPGTTAAGWQKALQNRQQDNMQRSMFRTALNTDVMKTHLGEIRRILEPEGGGGPGIEGVE